MRLWWRLRLALLLCSPGAAFAFDALNMAIRYRSAADVQGLLRDGTVDPSRPGENGMTPLVVAVTNRGDVPFITAILVAAGADVDAKNEQGQTALMMAAYSWNKRIVSILVGAGADPNAKDNRGLTPLMHAVRRPPQSEEDPAPREIMEVLLNAGASAVARDNGGQMAVLHAMAAGQSSDTLKALRMAMQRQEER